MSFDCNDYTGIGYYKKAKIVVSRKDKKVYLIAINNYGKNIELNISWSFKLLEEKLNLKLKYLALVMVYSRYINNQ